MREATRTWFGMIAVAASGVITAVMIVVRGTFIDAAYTPEAFAQAGGSANWIAYSLGTMLAIWLGVYGFVALYAYLARVNPSTAALAFWGMVMNIGLILLLPALGVYAFAGPPVAALYRSNAQLATTLSAEVDGRVFLLASAIDPIRAPDLLPGRAAGRAHAGRE
jgi:hypothetical protein